jgi:hypothetical protein
MLRENAIALVRVICHCTLHEELDSVELALDRNAVIMVFPSSGVFLGRATPPLGLGHDFPSQQHGQ